MKIKKKIGGGGRSGGCFGWGGGCLGLGGQGGCERRIEVFVKIKKKKKWGGVRRGVRVDVNAMLGVGGDVGYGGCEPRIEGIVQCTKRYTILRKLKKCGEGEGQYLNPKLYVFKKKKEKKKVKKKKIDRGD